MLVPLTGGRREGLPSETSMCCLIALAFPNTIVLCALCAHKHIFAQGSEPGNIHVLFMRRAGFTITTGR